MNFLQAHAALKSFQGGVPLRFTLGCSAVTATLNLYLRAHAAQAGYDAHINTLAFGSLAQHIRTHADAEASEVFLLMPWDFVPEADWRTGLPQRSPKEEDLHAILAEHVALFARRSTARFVYLPAPLPPVLSTIERSRTLDASIRAAAQSLGAIELAPTCFNLPSYLESGNPFSSRSLSEIAAAIVQLAVVRRREPKKVLVTDLDNTMWHGVIGEDGIDGIEYAPEGRGFRYFVYQTMLRKLRNEGVVLAAVSRNDRALALAAFVRGEMVLKETDFIAIIASYNSKSAQIEMLAQDLNLGLDSFVFVDDNPIEIEEVRRALPQVECLAVSHDAVELPALLGKLSEIFGRSSITEEDARRTEMYRLRVSSSAPNEARGADLREFLASLDMKLTLRKRRIGDHNRCLQLINKTNQFNINGGRLTAEELRATLEQGGHLIGATLEDRNGSHGEVIACLLTADGTIEAWVVSCRVFQRRVEFAFTAWLATQSYAPRQMRYVATERNEPSRRFLKEIGADVRDGLIPFDAQHLATSLADDLSLFRVVEPEATCSGSSRCD